MTPAGTAPHPVRPGRPRSEQAEQAICDAVLDLLRGGTPYGELSVEAVAARAGVGKATIYRRWPNKEGMVIDALTRLEAPMPPIPPGPVRQRLVSLLVVMVQQMEDRYAGQVFPIVMAESERHPELTARFQEVAIEPRREAVRQVLREGVAGGELRADTDIDRAQLMLSAPIVYAMKIMHPRRDVTPEFIEHVVDDYLRGFGAGE